MTMFRSGLFAKRRRFLSGVASTAAGIFVHAVAPARSGVDAQLAVAYEEPGRPVAADFVGLSYESAILAGGDYFNADNGSLLGLIRTLSDNGVIRIGGNTSERTVWQIQPRPAPPGSFIVTPANIDRLAAALRALGWRLIYGLNLARGTPEDAAEEAAYVARAVGPNLLAFQIGNEPDGFGRWTGVRPRTYDVAAFLAQWRTFHAAVRWRVHDAHFAGPDVAAATDWVATFAAEHPQGLVLLTRHYYADGPAGAPHVTLAKLLQSGREIGPVLEKLARCSQAYRLPYRIVETNSVYNEGQPGVSDTLGAALWGAELMFRVATAGAGGVNFHTGVHNIRASDDKAYTPIARSGNGGYRATPLYYGILLFAQAARGALVPTRLASGSDDLKAFAVRARDGTLRVCLINMNFWRGARVSIDPGRSFAAASVMRLAGPAADATAGVTLGETSVDEFGRWVPATDAGTPLAGREVVVDVPAVSAAVLSLRA
jgi:hypothetical protein